MTKEELNILRNLTLFKVEYTISTFCLAEDEEQAINITRKADLLDGDANVSEVKRLGLPTKAYSLDYLAGWTGDSLVYMPKTFEIDITLDEALTRKKTITTEQEW